MKNVVKACDLPSEIAVRVFEWLNQGRVTFYARPGNITVLCKGDPNTLTYLEGWWYDADNDALVNVSEDGEQYQIKMLSADKPTS